jgi:ATP-dependent protease ClpP protease subunit
MLNCLTFVRHCAIVIQQTITKGVILTRSLIYGLLAVVVIGGVTFSASMASRKGNNNTQAVATSAVSIVPTSQVASSNTFSPVESKDSAVKVEKFKVDVRTVSASDVVLFNTPVSGETVDAAIELLSEARGSTIYLVLDSPGGSVIDGARLINYIKYSGKNIVTVCDNMCASMAFQIFQVGKQRLMTDKAILMAHPASGGAQGTIENMFELIKMIKLYVDRLDAEIANRSGMKYSDFKALIADNIWAETPESLKMNLADGVVYLKTTGYGFTGSDRPQNVLEYLKRTGRFNVNIMQYKGYVFVTKKY